MKRTLAGRAFVGRAFLATALVIASTALPTGASTAPPASASTALPASASASAAPPVRASLTTIERQVMCVTCKIPLNVAESPQANRERVFIRSLIAQGKDEGQIKDALVEQYGPSALALPSDKGFDATAYLVPLAVVLGLLVLLVLLLPSWRRHALAMAGRTSTPPRLDPGDAARLDADLKSFD